MNLTRLFDLSLVGRAGSLALEEMGERGVARRFTFGEIDQRANRLARELSARGVGPGDRLCAHLANRVEMIDLFLACTHVGAIFVPINILYRERELRHIVGDAEPKAIVAAVGGPVAYPESAPVWDVDELTASASGRPSDRPGSAPGADPGAPAAIIYTSGTTGAAKGAVLTHASFAANAINCVSCWRISEHDRYLAVLPLFHVHGLANGVCSWLISGCRMRLAERFDHRDAAAVFGEFEPTLFFGVPTIYVRLLEPAVIPDELARRIGERMRLFVSGSAPLPAHVLQSFAGRFGHTILERYGMSEALMIMTNPYDGERRPGSVGMPFPGVSARIVGDDGRVVGEGEVGEVQIRSPHLFAGYWRRDDATAAAFDDGWFRTGDLGVRSPDGYYTLRGRRGDVIISGGFNIYPREIEELLLEHPGVREAAVVGVSDPLRGEVPVAYVVADEALDVRALERLCREQLASFKLPRTFVRMDSLPRTALGKVQAHRLPAPESVRVGRP